MPVTITTTDCAEAKAMVQLRRMVALSSSFQTKVDDDYAACLARVYFEGVPGNDNLTESEGAEAPAADKPFASIWLIRTGWSLGGGGRQNHMIANGTLHLYLMTPRATGAEDWNDARLEAVQFLGNWERDIVALFGADDTSGVGTVAVAGEGHLAGMLVDTPAHEHTPKQIRESAGDFFFRHCAIQYGDSGGQN